MSQKKILSPKSPTIVCRDQDDCVDLDLKLSKQWLRIAIAGVFAGQGMMFSLALNMTPPQFGSTPYWILHGGLIFSSIVVMVFLGMPLFNSTWSMLRNRRSSIEGLFTLSLIGAFVGSLIGSFTGKGDVFYEIVAIVIAIYTFGRMLGERSQAKLKLESALLKERFDHATVHTESGMWQRTHIAAVMPGAMVRVNPGEPITVDGCILSGVGYVQDTALTGEPLPLVKRAGDFVRAGTYAVDCQFELEVIHSEGSRELDSILETVESADGRPSTMQTHADEMVHRFLPLVVCVALTTAIVWGLAGSLIDAALNSMAVLLVACPCALGLATPVAISQGLFRLAQLGLVSRDGAFIDVLARTERIFFDKTGTLSESSLRVVEFWTSSELPIHKEQLLRAVQVAEASVKHPVAQALTHFIETNNECPDPVEEPSELKLIPGQGVSFNYHGLAIKIGEASLAASEVAVEEATSLLHNPEDKRVFVFVGEQIAACFVLQEVIREGVDDVWNHLDSLNISAEILTGDPNPSLSVPKSVSIHAGLSAQEKVRAVMNSVQSKEEPLFIGDGINDAAAMASAHGSISMSTGAGLSNSVAMAQLRSDQIDIIPTAIRFSRHIHSKLKWNLIYAASYNILGMSLAAAGLLHPIAAAMIMLISSFFVSARAMNLPNFSKSNEQHL